MSSTSSRAIEMQPKKRLNCYECMKPLRSMSQIFGVSSFSVRVNPNTNQIQEATSGIFNVIWFIASIGLNFMFSYFAQSSARSSANTTSAVAFLCDRFMWTLQLSMCISSIILSMYHRNRFAKILRGINEIDKTVKMNF